MRFTQPDPLLWNLECFSPQFPRLSHRMDGTLRREVTGEELEIRNQPGTKDFLRVCLEKWQQAGTTDSVRTSQRNVGMKGLCGRHQVQLRGSCCDLLLQFVKERFVNDAR